jgi:uncharacterized phage-associated protein|nr:MAG TPA: Protein of unknown function (DUF4065) [Caudoviricetes sp.]DAN34851.1 MAG TPA: Protein of unknown function (DUF4065) [Caudoviricetes sp.]
MCLGISVNKEKIGNLMVYILKHQGIVFHTQLIKLLYLIDETAIKDDGIPVTWLDYKAWQFGPVAPETYYIKYNKSVFDSFIALCHNDIGENTLLLFPKVDFDDSEFSDYDMDIIDSVLKDYGTKSPSQLVNVTHEPGSLWDQTRIQYGIDFSKVTKTDHSLDFTKLIKDNSLKLQRFHEAKENMLFSKELQKHYL